MADERIPLDATDAIQVADSVREWINGLYVLPGYLWPEYVEDDPNGYGYCLKTDGGEVLEIDILGNYTASVPFTVYYTYNHIPGVGTAYKPLNDLAAWFRSNGVGGLDIGPRRTPQEITMLTGPIDMYGKNADSDVTFLIRFQLTFEEEAI